MNLPYYLIISREESVELTKNFSISLPASSRIIEDLGEIENLKEGIERKLIYLNIGDEKDYLVVLVDTERSSEVITISISDILKLYCLNESAQKLFKYTVNPNFQYGLLSELGIELDVSLLIKKSNHNKLDKIIQDDELFCFDREQIEPFMKGSYSALTEFKRECKLIPSDFSFFNDVVVIAALNSSNSEKVYKSYMAQENIAKKSSVFKKYESLNLKSLQELIVYIDGDTDDLNMEKLNFALSTSFGLVSDQFDDFSFFIFCLIYLKIMDVYQTESCGLVDVHNIYEEVSRIDGVEFEINSAFYLFLVTCGFENLYTEYYNFKRFNVATGSEVVSYSVLKDSYRQKIKEIQSLNANLNQQLELENTLQEENQLLKEQINDLSIELKSSREAQIDAPSRIESFENNECYSSTSSIQGTTEEVGCELNLPSVTLTFDEISSIQLSETNKKKLVQLVKKKGPELVESLKKSLKV